MLDLERLWQYTYEWRTLPASDQKMIRNRLLGEADWCGHCRAKESGRPCLCKWCWLSAARSAAQPVQPVPDSQIAFQTISTQTHEGTVPTPKTTYRMTFRRRYS